MSNRDGFGGGFFLGALVGGVVGGIVGAVVATRQTSEGAALDGDMTDSKTLKSRQRQLDTERIESARLSLEDKIAQLNEAIDDVREQLGSVNGGFVAHNGEGRIPEDI